MMRVLVGFGDSTVPGEDSDDAKQQVHSLVTRLNYSISIGLEAVLMEARESTHQNK